MIYLQEFFVLFHCNNFLLQKGEFVVITRLFAGKDEIECLYEGNVGIYKKSDINIVSTVKKLERED